MTLDLAALRPAALRLPARASALADESFLVGLLALWAVAFAAVGAHALVQDSWMTLVGGRDVAAYWLPHAETLSAIPHGRGWIDQQWLAELGFYGAWKAGGIRLVLALQAVTMEAVLVVGVVTARRLGASRRGVASATMLALVLAPWALQLRAQTFALLLFALVFSLLVLDSGAPSARVLLVLPLLVVWANVHGSVVLAAGLVVLRALTRVLGGRLSRAEALRTLALLVGAPLAVFASPYALELPHYYALMLLHPPFAAYVVEWQPTVLGPLTVAFFVVAGVLAALAGRHRGRLTRFEELALLALAAASLTAERNVVWFALAVLVSAPRLLSEVNDADTEPRARDNKINLAVAGAALVLAVGLAAAGPVGAARGPVRVADKVAALSARDPSLRVFPNDGWGDWLLWTHPELAGRVAYDVRFELMTHREVRSLALLRSGLSGRLARGYRLFVVDRRRERTTRAWLLDVRHGRVVARDGSVEAILLPRA
ncbi:MAG: hypothetical protein ACXVZ4_03090 [Gaiellaceae bacterium]